MSTLFEVMFMTAQSLICLQLMLKSKSLPELFMFLGLLIAAESCLAAYLVSTVGVPCVH